MAASSDVPPADERSWLRRHAVWLVLGGAIVGVIAAAAMLFEREVLLDEAPRLVAVFRDIPADVPFARGLRLAVDEVNESGGINGEQLVLEEVLEEDYDLETSAEIAVSDTLSLANSIARRSSVLAVIGHDSSATAVPASSVYDRHETVFLATHATTVSLTEHGFRYVFGLLPNNADGAAVIAQYAIDQGMHRFVVLSDDSDYGLEAGNQFRRFVTTLGAEILFDGDLAHHKISADRLLLFMLDNEAFDPDDIDAFFLGSISEDETIRFIERSRELGLTKPILGVQNIYSTYIEQEVGAESMAGVASSSTFAAESTDPQAVEFTKAFEARFGEPPDVNAAIGYDAVKLFAFVAARVRPFDSTRMADRLRVLRYEEPFVGVTGTLVFDSHGLVTDTDIYVVRHDGTSFRTVGSYRKPLDKIDQVAEPAPVLVQD
ncbi:MAG: ABC transporter substrate-binding protein [Pseudomonadota bacterium]